MQTISALGAFLSASVTAVATIFLWLVTKNLAAETRRMVDAGSRPHVVATIEPNRWSMIHADLKVDNTGNATAYDIEISFDPAIDLKDSDTSGVTHNLPLNRISVLKPGQGLSSYLSEFTPLLRAPFQVTISWTRNPLHDERETNCYVLNVKDLEGIVRLGSDPLTQIAEDIKKMREDWARVSSGSKRLQLDAYLSGDRLHEARKQQRWLRQRKKNRGDT